MEQLSGIVEGLSSYNKVSPRSGKNMTLWRCTINGQEVGLGFKTTLQEGQQVTLPVEFKYGGYQLVQNSIPSNVPQTTAPTNGTSDPHGSAIRHEEFPVGINTRGTSISRQSSLNRAVESVNAMLTSKILVMKTEQEYLDKVIEIAYIYTDFATGQREVKQAGVMAGYDAE